MKNNVHILWVEDDSYFAETFSASLQLAGYHVEFADNVKSAKQAIKKFPPRLVIVDIMLPLSRDKQTSEPGDHHQGGVDLAVWIKKAYPKTKIVCATNLPSGSAVEALKTHCDGFVDKYEIGLLLSVVDRVLGRSSQGNPRAFIVHGRDNTAKQDLKNYLQNTLGWPEPIILHEQPNGGLILLEKFESLAAAASVVFVLLTPDDIGALASESNDLKRRSRQNVIFEMGYFIGRLGRNSGRILLLHQGPLELPSDLDGIIYIDISNGVLAAGELLRRELQLFTKPRAT